MRVPDTPLHMRDKHTVTLGYSIVTETTSIRVDASIEVLV